ncbi:hypothetical protein [Microbacterium saperdae]|uniref:Uncharacterized protein n=1 Tax=Microbacterium saperdae TaxID=69368 RepID=A0A543BQU2_9MICO|nr:hypothetical protein [Microbacterium saperdae]TQL87199.1 hypothetical protein FB560_2866 [Microbacterium saperdae]GGM42141.1 hypothetical protein GCM10010489_11510 [Microbacterium saperdae]
MNKIWFPLQRAIRTAIAVILASVTILATTAALAPQILTAVQDVLPGPVVAWLSGAIVGLTAISAALSRVMAIPAVDAWLRKFGAGSAPRTAIVYNFADGSTQGLTRREWRAFVDAGSTAPHPDTKEE